MYKVTSDRTGSITLVTVEREMSKKVTRQPMRNEKVVTREKKSVYKVTSEQTGRTTLVTV
ncbi:MAG: hypothetical protein K6A30_03880 [Lachnospiraceae bacterium]|nr:hypothetical protein [Lachnospiraceae bacterium]